MVRQGSGWRNGSIPSDVAAIREAHRRSGREDGEPAFRFCGAISCPSPEPAGLRLACPAWISLGSRPLPWAGSFTTDTEGPPWLLPHLRARPVRHLICQQGSSQDRHVMVADGVKG